MYNLLTIQYTIFTSEVHNRSQRIILPSVMLFVMFTGASVGIAINSVIHYPAARITIAYKLTALVP